jgi:hypothetical protein
MPQQDLPQGPQTEAAPGAEAFIETVAATQQEALEGMETAANSVFEGLTLVQREIADFVAERIRQDMEAHQELLRCRSFDDVRQVQARFFKTALGQYSAGTSRLLKLGGDVAARSVERGRD